MNEPVLLPDLLAKPNWRKRFIYLGLLALVVALAFAAKPAYRHLKHRRAQQFVAQAEILLDDQRWEEAMTKAQSALQLSPDNTGALRFMAQLLSRLNRAEAIGYWDAVLSRPDGTHADRLSAAAAALQLHRLDAAEKHLTAALQRQPVDVETFRLAAIFTDRKGDWNRAIQFAQAVLAHTPDSDEMNLLLARQFIRSQEPGAIERAKTILSSNASNQTPVGLESLRIFSQIPGLSAAEMNECAAQILKHPHRTVADEFLAQDLQFRTAHDPDLVTAEVVRRHRGGPPLELLELGRWLNRHGHFERTIEVISEELALSHQDFFLVYLDAFAGRKDWLRVRQFLERDKLPLHPVLRELYRARTAQQLRQDTLAALHWEQAYSAAVVQPDTLWYVAEYAEKLGQERLAVRAYEQLAKNVPSARRAYAGLIRIAERNGDTARLLDIINSMLVLYPNDPVPRNDSAYLSLLLNKNIDRARSIAEELVQAYPAYLAYRTTLALANLRANRPEDAQAAYGSLEIDWTDVLPGWQAVRAAVLGQNGHTAAARELARNVPVARLKAEERELLQPYL